MGPNQAVNGKGTANLSTVRSRSPTSSRVLFPRLDTSRTCLGQGDQRAGVTQPTQPTFPLKSAVNWPVSVDKDRRRIVNGLWNWPHGPLQPSSLLTKTTNALWMVSEIDHTVLSSNCPRYFVMGTCFFHILYGRGRLPLNSKIFGEKMKWCLMSSDVSWHIRDKLWPMPKHGSIILYVHGKQKAR